VPLGNASLSFSNKILANYTYFLPVVATFFKKMPYFPVVIGT